MLKSHIRFHPPTTQSAAEFLAQDLQHYNEAAWLYVDLLNQPEYTATQRKDLWMALANICTKHSIEGLDWDGMVRAVIGNPKFLPPSLEGVLWTQLADSWIRQGEFDLARSVYEEALERVSKVRDFTILLDAYLKFEEGLLEATMEASGDDDMETEEGEAAVDPADWDLLLPSSTANDQEEAKPSMADLELTLARTEDSPA